MMSIDEIMKISEETKVRDEKRAKAIACQKFGFNKNGWVWLLLEDLTDFGRKEEFKHKGGRYDRILGWHSINPVDGFKMKKVEMDAIGEVENGVWQTRRYRVDVVRKEACRNELNKRLLKSEFVGTLGKNSEIVTRVKLVSAKETMFRDANCGNPDYYGLPFECEYIFNDKNGNVIIFSSAFYKPDKVKEWFGKRWANLKAMVFRHDDRHGVKITRIRYPNFVIRGKVTLRDYARIKNPRGVKDIPSDMIE